MLRRLCSTPVRTTSRTTGRGNPPSCWSLIESTDSSGRRPPSDTDSRCERPCPRPISCGHARSVPRIPRSDTREVGAGHGMTSQPDGVVELARVDHHSADARLGAHEVTGSGAGVTQPDAAAARSPDRSRRLNGCSTPSPPPSTSPRHTQAPRSAPIRRTARYRDHRLPGYERYSGLG